MKNTYKVYELLAETSPDRAGDIKLNIRAKSEKEAIKEFKKFIKEKYPHLYKSASIYVN